MPPQHPRHRALYFFDRHQQNKQSSKRSSSSDMDRFSPEHCLPKGCLSLDREAPGRYFKRNLRNPATGRDASNPHFLSPKDVRRFQRLLREELEGRPVEYVEVSMVGKPSWFLIMKSVKDLTCKRWTQVFCDDDEGRRDTKKWSLELEGAFAMALTVKLVSVVMEAVLSVAQKAGRERGELDIQKLRKLFSLHEKKKKKKKKEKDSVKEGRELVRRLVLKVCQQIAVLTPTPLPQSHGGRAEGSSSAQGLLKATLKALELLQQKEGS